MCGPVKVQRELSKMERYFPLNEKIDMYNVYIRNYRNAVVAARVYHELYPERRQPDPSSFRRVWARVNQKGHFENRRKRNPNNQRVSEINVLAQIHINPETSQRKISEDCNLSKSCVQKILKKHKLHDFKFQPVQTLHVGDEQRRLQFCRWFRNELDMDPYFCQKILWTDETLFTNSGIFNRKNKHHYATNNPHLIRSVRPQVRFSVNIWCGLIDNRILGPYFLRGNLTGRGYAEFLQNGLEEMLDNLSLETIRNLIYFQQDGAGPHNAIVVRDILDRRFPGSWIGSNGPVRWPPRSPCLNPLDYFLWGFAKNSIYNTPIESEEQLRDKIINFFRTIDPECIRRATSNMDQRTLLCINSDGGHFEQFL